MTGYDATKLCKKTGDGQYEVDPATMFPATLARIQEVLTGKLPTEIVAPGWKGHPLREPATDRFLRQAEAFPPEAWKLAEMEDFQIDPDELEPRLLADKQLRGVVLDFAESWFKRALALKVGRGLRLHISRNSAYRRV